MTKERKTALVNNSMYNTPVDHLTIKEFHEGYHYCYDFDQLLVGPADNTCPEWGCCGCHPIKNGGMTKYWTNRLIEARSLLLHAKGTEKEKLEKEIKDIEEVMKGD